MTVEPPLASTPEPVVPPETTAASVSATAFPVSVAAPLESAAASPKSAPDASSTVAPGSGTAEPDHYTHGHHESVLAAHRRRTAANSAGYLLAHLRPNMRLLDVGCGPGTITVDLATRVASAAGVDTSEIALEAARRHAAEVGVACEFTQAYAEALPFADASFDVVHAHQVLQHLPDPVAALREMKRVTRLGGLVAVRDADYAAMTWYPPSDGLDEWNALYRAVARANGGEPDAGRKLLAWVHAAGLDPGRVTASASAWCYATPAERAAWGASWATRCTESAFAEHARAAGLADDAALDRLARAWLTWADEPDGWFAVLHGEVLARV